MTEPSDEGHTLRSLGSAPVRRTRAVIRGALLALAAVVPAASIAAEPDTTQEGLSAPDQAQDLETDSPSFDPGGDTDLPFDTGAPPGSSPPVSPDDAPLESEPTDDPDGRAAPFAEPEAPATGMSEDAPARPLDGGQPSAPPAPGFTIEPAPPSLGTPSPETSPPPVPQSLPDEPGSHPALRRRSVTAVVRVDRPSSQGSDMSASADSPDPAADSNQVPVSQAATGEDRPVALRNGSTARQGARIHTVRPGESLWAIAADLLGPDASATIIAAEVARLWELNREHIPSGDPDLIAVGQRLRLR